VAVTGRFIARFWPGLLVVSALLPAAAMTRSGHGAAARRERPTPLPLLVHVALLLGPAAPARRWAAPWAVSTRSPALPILLAVTPRAEARRSALKHRAPDAGRRKARAVLPGARNRPRNDPPRAWQGVGGRRRAQRDDGRPPRCPREQRPAPRRTGAGKEGRPRQNSKALHDQRRWEEAGKELCAVSAW
jgi:hypothetical protein